ncbi:NCS2 family permease [Isoptericola sp. b441]|uniref:NCS2 family permease n=1 Tax=Actinotalea lenta TaxID=3064654 RepID=A0ABT9D739_9CELL|nr:MULTISPECIES: NCS2 family permease [unclassified Isoptericola]MDO8106668.1 NCS2 family permease [Isoptericola sp. b441]MDO8121624.1 NCS2 family permease [Isoptericola sp. b490]
MAQTTETAPPTSVGPLDSFFKITERGSTIGTEIRGGLVTFFTMAYIIVLNPIILGGQDSLGNSLASGSTIAATTALVAGVMTIMMGVVARFPLALATGLGINAVVAYSIATTAGWSWQDAMGIVVVEGVVILVLVLTGFRRAVFNAVPTWLKTAISVGIGLFIAFIGFVDAGFVTPGAGTIVDLGQGGSLTTWPVLVFVIGLLLTVVLMVRKVRGAILIAILGTTLIAIVVEAVAKVGGYAGGAGNPAGWRSTVPAFPDAVVATPNFSLLGHFSVLGPFAHSAVLAVVLIFSLLLADFFDTMGTMVAVGAEAGLNDKDGNPPSTQQILVVDSIGAIAGGASGVSSNTCYIESASGVGDGARTGLASVVTGVAFLLATFLSPLVEIIPAEAAAPALVIVGFLMVTQVLDIDWRSWELAIPAFFTMVLMPFTYSITVGIGAGVILYVLLQLAVGKAKKVHPLIWLIAALFVVYFVRGPIQSLVG